MPDTAHEMNILPNGIWDCDTTEPHTFDAALAMAIISFLTENHVETVTDLGCGAGEYVSTLLKFGFGAIGYDGNPNTGKFFGLCYVKDLSQKIEIEKCDCIISLEVGEHIPKEFEAVFLDNVCDHANRFVILSWFPDVGSGSGHVNEQSNDYIKDQMLNRGFWPLDQAAEKMRESASSWWFKKSLMCFKKI